MKKMLYRLFPVVMLLIVPAISLADTSVDSATFLRVYEQRLTGIPRQSFAPATEFLGIDADKLGDGNLSIHFYGWGRVDLADKSFNNEKAEGNLNYGYLQYRFGNANANVRLGRFFVSEGVINEQVDGLSLRTDLPFGFGVSAFGGATVHTVNMLGKKVDPVLNTTTSASFRTDGKGDGIAGGRLNYRYGGILELGASGIYETKAPTYNGSTLQKGIDYGNHRILGGDIWLSPHRMVEMMGHSTYNTETKGVAEHSYMLNIKPHKDLMLTGEFDEHRERDLFYSSYLFARILESNNADPKERSRSYGGKASLGISKEVEIAGDYKHYKRDIGQADRFGGDIRLRLLDNMVRGGLGYHYLRSGPNFAIVPTATASGSYHAIRGYVMADRPNSVFASLDLTTYVFKANADGKKSTWELVSSLGYHITPALALSGDISYGQNPLYKNDLQGLIRLTYNMNYTGKGDYK